MFKAKMGYKAKLQHYYRLSKPGIIYANVLTAFAGYLLASRWQLDAPTLIGLLVGTALVIASACAANNVLDRRIDALMPRTQKRALITGELQARQAMIYSSLSGLVGLGLLLLTQNVVTTGLIIVAFIDYVFVYGYAKRTSPHGTLAGCISGAIPLMAGYTAVGGRLDVTAWLLFGLMVAWQMAHFYGIALFRLADYSQANIPVMPAARGEHSTQYQTLGYIVLFAIFAILLGLTKSLNAVAVIGIFILAVVWLLRAATSMRRVAPGIWGRQTFGFSLIVMLGMSVGLSVGSL